jgi:hypothetical protein
VKYKKTFKTATPKREISILRGQIRSLNERGLCNESEPSLCEFCDEFWIETYHDWEGGNECEWGCNVGVDIDDWPCKIRCRTFKTKDDFSIRIKARLIQSLFQALNNVAPYNKTLTNIKLDIETAKKEFHKQMIELDYVARQREMLDVLARIREGKNEKENSANLGPP